MAFSAHQDDESMQERLDAPAVLEAKLDKLADLVRRSRHMVAFTGAGISTSAGIPDFRGPKGVWTLQAKGETRTDPTVSTSEAFATPTHMALVALQREGTLKHLISQNCDGLHRRSGFDPTSLSELHGNSNMEECESCEVRFFRDFKCRRLVYQSKDHYTGRRCPLCDGRLLEWTIDFGQDLPCDMIESGFRNAHYADLHLALGSSLTVSPACDMPAIAGNSSAADLVVVNLQNTPLDDLCTVRIYAKTDAVMEGLMLRLGMDIPKWKLHRKILVIHEAISKDGVVTDESASGAKRKRDEDGDGEPDSLRLVVQGVDPFQDHLPASLFKSATVNGQSRNLEPMSFALPGETDKIKVNMRWQGHYDEPDFEFAYRLSEHDGNVYYLNLVYDPFEKTWNVGEIKPMSPDAVRLPRSLLQATPGQHNSGSFPAFGHPGCWASADLTTIHGENAIAVLGGTHGSHQLINVTTLQQVPFENTDLADNNDANEDVKHKPFVGTKRWGHSATRVHIALSRLIVFGGQNETDEFNDVWVYDPARPGFVSLVPVLLGDKPCPRSFHGASMVGNKHMYVFGGASRSGNRFTFHNDLWYLNLDDTEKKWKLVKPKGTPPPPRAQHAQVTMGHYVVVAGGLDATRTFTDMYICDTIKMQWVRMCEIVPGLTSRDHRLADDTEMPVIRPSLSRVGAQSLALVSEGGLHLFNTRTMSWSEKVVGGCPHVVGHSVANNGSTLFLLGGEIFADGRPAHHITKIKV